MMIRGLLFILFLYTLLVWVVAAYLGGEREEIFRRGLFWTAAGIGALILWLIIERVWSWWRLSKARQTARPVSPVAPTKALHPDDAALQNLLAEAEQRLTESASFRGTNTRILDLPMYLLVGGEGTGKTAVMENSGLGPVLLAGQVAGGLGGVAPTRVANLWLANEKLYLEISGRIFNGDLTRFNEFIQSLRAQPKLTGLQKMFGKSKLGRLFAQPAPPPTLRGVLLFFSTREFSGTPEPSKLDHAGQLIRDRLDALAAHFGSGCPVYVLFTKADCLPFYQDFFARFSESEAGQVFGTLNNTKESSSNQADKIWAEAETRRFGKYFNRLFLRLSDRRTLALATEASPHQKPAVYEFPREFKRIRTPLVQFLVDVFKPNPLKASPSLRGFFFTGTRQVEMSAGRKLSDLSQTFASPGGGLDATQIFRPSATQIFTPGPGGQPVASTPMSKMSTSWMFLTDFFHQVLPQDRPAAPRPVRAAGSPIDQYGRLLAGAVAGLGFLAALVWTISWFSNRELISESERLIAQNNRLAADLSITSLRPLDDLRQQVQRLEKNDSWYPHWGLYTGDDLLRVTKQAYFKRLKAVMLDGANAILTTRLQNPGQGGGESVYDTLKTHITISSKTCAVDKPLLNRVLDRSVRQYRDGLPEENYDLARRQISYYADELDSQDRTPVNLGQDTLAIEKARAQLAESGGLEQQLNSLLKDVAKQTKPISVAERIPEYTKTLSGPSEFPGQFTKPGSLLMEQLIENGNWNGGEECVTGKGTNVVAGLRQDNETKNQLRYLYYKKYSDAWREFLRGFHVLPYGSISDAAQKLERLSGPLSPLLALNKLAAENTYFPAKAGEVSQLETYASKLGLDKILGAKKNAEKNIDKAEAILAGPTGLTAGDVTKLFQPVQVTTPADKGVLVSEGNQSYVAGLRTLQLGLDALSRVSRSEFATAIPAAQQALAQAKQGHAGLADKFADTGNQGLNTQLAQLLMEPIQLADRVIPSNFERSQAGAKNGELAALCRQVQPVFSKYPFNPRSDIDSTASEIVGLFRPNAGAVWAYQQKSLAELVVKQGEQWVPAAPKPRVSPDLVRFLNRAQELSNVFFPGGGAMMQVQLRYVLRPLPRQGPPIRLRIDGKEMNTQASALQTDFVWPAPPGQKAGATGELVSNDFSTGFGQYDGFWGVFRLFQNADERVYGDQKVQWSEMRGKGGATPQKINPPAQLQFVQFPGGIDLFNPKFFQELHCPAQAVLPE